IIANHTPIDYGKTDDYLQIIDGQREGTEVDLLYSPEGRAVNSRAGEASGNVWNREHVWPRSRGLRSDGASNSDLHNLYACDLDVNALRDRLLFDFSQEGTPAPEADGSTMDADSWEPADEDKGKVARALLYMATRYQRGGRDSGSLRLVEEAADGDPEMGRLSVLLEWNRTYPPDAREIQRNEGIFHGVTSDEGWLRQGNRNPFIDEPLWADLIYLETVPLTRESWLLQHFSFHEIRDDSIGGPDADPDLDGLPNQLEFFLATNPTLRNSPFLAAKREDGKRYFQMTRLSDPGKFQLAGKWETSADGEEWQASEPIETILVKDQGDVVVETLIFEDKGEMPLSFRLRAVPLE
ncbi:MAG: endonuclease, partial [Verrucomicrobiota bacterium]